MRRLFLFMCLSTGPAAHASDAQGLATSATWFDRYKPDLSREDCSGLVSDILNRAGFDIYGTVTTIHAWASRRGWIHHPQRLQAGDVVFWDRTYDSNDNGRADDKLTHIGVVVAVNGHGTATVVHRGSSQGISTVRMNLEKPDVYRDGDDVLNSYLVRKTYAGEDGPRLTGQLFAGVARVGSWSSPQRVATAARTARPPMPMPHVVPMATIHRQPEGSRREVRAAAKVDRQSNHPRHGRPGAMTVARVRYGTPLTDYEVRRLDCDELWWTRNAVFARHGYAFGHEKTQAAFNAEGWYQRNPEVRLNTIRGLLSDIDQRNVRLVLSYERGCPTP
jgi:hypothetical protein